MPKLKKNYTPEDVLKIREQARLRAKKFYDANKEKISLQKKEKWAAIMAVAPTKKSNIIKTQIVEPEILPVDEPFVFVEEEKIDEPVIIKDKIASAKKKNIYAELKKSVHRKNVKRIKKIKEDVHALSQAGLKEIEEELEEELKKEPVINGKINKKTGKISIPIDQEDAIDNIETLDVSRGTKTKYINDLKTLLNITGCDDLRQCLKQSKKIISEIENAKQKRDPTLSYGINTKKSLYQTILFLITNLKIDLKESTIERYKSKFEEYKILSRDKTAENKVSNDESVMDYKEYVKKILQKFGVKSKQYLVARLYDELTCRDNYGNLEIVENMKDVKPNKNYIVVPRKRITLVLQEFKTDTAYPAVHHKVSDSLDTLIRSYLSENELSYGDTLLGKSLLSSFVGEMNRAIGIENGSINYIRHSKITTELSSSKLSPAERIELAKKSQHSVITQLSYVRKLKDV